MTERDKELMAEAEAYADYNFKGEVYWREAYESRLVELIRADEREACAQVCEPQEQHDDPLTAWKIAAAIRARGNT